MPDIHLSTFDFDVSPPIGHPLCGGWITPANAVDNPLRLRGIVIDGSGPPILIAALDWTGVMNESYRIWTERLAEAARTTPDRVSLHCVHQHNAPFVDLDGNALLRNAGADRLLYDEKFFETLTRRSAEVVRASLKKSIPVTHVAHGESNINQVACNRRVVGADGKIKFTRYSATKDPLARAEPDGTIDPVLRSISYFASDRPIARLYYYTVHPMSYYGDGRVTSDFVGIARDRRDVDEPDALHIYFTGSAGNVTAGKYNDGSKPNRAILADRVYQAMVAADRAANGRTDRLEHVGWITSRFLPSPREDLDLDRLKAVVATPKETTVNRNRSAMMCGWLIRTARSRPLTLSRLDLGPKIAALHLPAETFVEYQLEAQTVRPKTWLATAAYGDGGPWYIPLTRSYAEGGYEPSASFVSSLTEPLYRAAIRALLLA